MDYSISNEKLKDIALNFGTPLYVYDSQIIKHQFDKLQNAFLNANTKIFYAAKALTNINILKYINKIGCNIDCSSINEVRLALIAGFEPKNILYTSNGINIDEIIEAIDFNVNVNIDSISNLKKFGLKYGNTYPVGIRLRPNIMAGGNLKISTGHNKSKFGIPITLINDVLEIVEQYDLNIYALHIHTGSEIKDVDIFVKGLDVLFEIAPKFKYLKVIDLGGGFKVPYKESDTETDISLLGKLITDYFEAYKQKTGINFEIWFEPGKYLVSQSGCFIASVNVLKEDENMSFIGLNTGFNHLIRPMFYDSYHEIKNISSPTNPLKKYTVTGNLCETDNFAMDRLLPITNDGDLIVFLNAGAYGFEMSSNFNSRLKPAEVMIEDNEVKLIRKRDVFDDLLMNIIL